MSVKQSNENSLQQLEQGQNHEKNPKAILITLFLFEE